MTKSKAPKQISSSLPLAPWIYLNDCLHIAETASALAALVPTCAVVNHVPNLIGGLGTSSNGVADTVITLIKNHSYRNTVCIIADDKDDLNCAAKQNLANQYREAAIKHGCNFVSVNVTYTDEANRSRGWGANHVSVVARDLEPKAVAEKIFKALFKVLTVPETLHLISEKEMLTTDKSFPQYTYCSIADSRHQPKDAKVQFVALITSKPEIGSDQRLHWTVADRTGVANFYFQWRGPESKYTWDWVLNLQPGERKALPRMPMVKVKEKTGVTIAKAPFRGVAMVVGGAGLVIKGVGKGLCHAGNKVKMGNRSQWVPEADVKKDGKKAKLNATNVRVVHGGAKTEIKVFNEKGQKTWKEDDDDASTTAGSIYDEKICREFC